MRKQILLFTACSMALGLLTLTSCGRKMKPNEYTKDGKLKVTLRHLYMGDYAGGDRYLQEIENKFKIKFSKIASYSWNDWETEVMGTVNADKMEDIFHYNIDSYNFSQTYKFWAEEEMIKPLPQDLSKWPNIKTMIENTSNIDALKIDGKLYGLPIAKNTSDYSTSYSPFTYIYRRDWAKKLGVYKENDVYTWQEFETLLEAFKNYLAQYNKYALADVEWGFPSITNFYKQVPHCFAQDATGKYVNNYTTDEYIAGLNKSKAFMDNGWYHPDQNTAQDGEMNKKYYSNQVGVLYENLSYSNFVQLKAQLRATNVDTPNFEIDDAMAIMKIKNEEGKYCLEGTDNWFSMTFFDFKIEQSKEELILDVLDYLLGEEGTRFSVFGFENYDYQMVDGKPEIIEEAWTKDPDTGEFAPKDNGAKYLRYMVSLGYDTLEDDPLTDKAAFTYLDNWDKEMRTALEDGDLRVLKENKEVMWLTTPKKSLNSGTMRTAALQNVMKYVYGKDGITTVDKFKKTFGNIWKEVLDEINAKLGH